MNASGGLTFGGSGTLTGIGEMLARGGLTLAGFYGLTLLVPTPNVVPGPSANGYEFYPQPFGAFPVPIGINEPYAFDWTAYLSNFWQPGAHMQTYSPPVRPSSPNGYQYRCTQAGESADTEPTWPIVLGLTVIDGSAIWTCEDVDTTSLLSSVASAQWSAAFGIAATFGAITATSTPVLIDTADASAGTDYPVSATVSFSDGSTRVGTMLFQIPQSLA
ncbi:hypothetical protein [Bradyrhizobium sp.]|uniref:hypothetical protein n=1 Tax=Bradyrhizobium sp. TaxID=376 RepID=UPI003C6922E2